MKYNSNTTFLGHYTKTNIKDELHTLFTFCKKFTLSVSFIRESGLNIIYGDLIGALDRGVEGTIITCDYNHFTEVSCLQKLYNLSKKYPNLKCYFINVDNSDVYTTFHTKGYIFEDSDNVSIIIGSSNLSDSALSLKGGEWSLLSKTTNNEELFNSIKNECEYIIRESCKELTLDIIADYSNTIPEVKFGTVEPNFMQEEALKELIATRNKGINKALIVAAMGSGKTLLSAFDAKNFGANHILYVCHSETILRKSRDEFERVFSHSKSYGFYVDREKNNNCDIIFATNQSLSRHLLDFKENYFDYIIIDEAHHTPARTFKAIVDYFKCDFLLGMTGTPDRLDQKDVRSIFGNTIPYELSLRDAIKYGIIMPFKYYSVSDTFVDYSINNDSGNLIREMILPEHGYFISQKINEHINEINGKIKCISFCVNVEHAKAMSTLMNQIGFNTTYITGETPIDERRTIFANLQDEKEPLQIVFSINVLNEGVDIPDINMSLFLRPTESTTIFIQQLGRSLRKSENKKKPVIIDFVGRKYERSTYIAWALGSLVNAPVLTKAILKKVLSGDRSMCGDIDVEIHMDSGSKDEINKYLDKYNFNRLDILKKSYDSYKAAYALSTFPSHTNFLSTSSGFDIMRIIATHKSYYNFLKTIKEVNVPNFSKEEREFIDYISSFLPLTRPYEFKIISLLIEYKELSLNELEEKVKTSCGELFNDNCFNHALLVLQRKCDSDSNQEKLKKYVTLNNGKYRINSTFEDLEIQNNVGYIELDFNNSEFKSFILDILQYGLLRFEDEYSLGGNEFEIYHTYSRKEFTRVANFHSVYSFQPGVFYTDDGQVALFIDMIKKANVEEHLDYGDKFLSIDSFIWESQTETEIGNNRYNKLMSYDKALIFVRKFQKEDGLSLPYVYIGKGKLKEPEVTTNAKKTLKFKVVLDNKLPEELFEQFNIQEDDEE